MEKGSRETGALSVKYANIFLIWSICATIFTNLLPPTANRKAQKTL